MRKVFLLALLLLELSASSLQDGKQSGKRFLEKISKQDVTKHQKKWLPERYKYVESIAKDIKEKQPILTITYLTSSSVPVASHVSFITEMSKLEKEFNIQSKMCMIGIESKEFPKFITDLMQELGKMPRKQSGSGMDFCPELFERLELTQVPAYAISVCDSQTLHPEECKVRYLIRGDMSLKFMLEKLANENEYFKEFVDAL
ncbi:MAG TPA: hypothetical protein EYG78_00840 [Sulfurovum sp.]|nr:hypothetical protein [Sulfurovum sp.]